MELRLHWSSVSGVPIYLAHLYESEFKTSHDIVARWSLNGSPKVRSNATHDHFTGE